MVITLAQILRKASQKLIAVIEALFQIHHLLHSIPDLTMEDRQSQAPRTMNEIPPTGSEAEVNKTIPDCSREILTGINGTGSPRVPSKYLRSTCCKRSPPDSNDIPLFPSTASTHGNNRQENFNQQNGTRTGRSQGQFNTDAAVFDILNMGLGASERVHKVPTDELLIEPHTLCL